MTEKLIKEIVDRQIQELVNTNHYIESKEIEGQHGLHYLNFNVTTDFYCKFSMDISLNYEGIKCRNRITVFIPKDFSLPSFFDNDNKIPHNQKFCIFEDGMLGLSHPKILKYEWKRNPNLKCFIEEFVIPFYFSVNHYMQFGEYPFGKYSSSKWDSIKAVLSIMRVNIKRLFAVNQKR